MNTCIQLRRGVRDLVYTAMSQGCDMYTAMSQGCDNHVYSYETRCVCVYSYEVWDVNTAMTRGVCDDMYTA